MAVPQSTTMQADQLEIAGQLITYLNAGQGNGQAIIDANPNLVATWGGASVQSGDDGANTHFIGHNPGIFNVLFSVGVGETISVSDGANNVRWMILEWRRTEQIIGSKSQALVAESASACRRVLMMITI